MPILKNFFTIMLLIYTVACAKEMLPAAPLNDRTVLEQLAQTYDRLSEAMPMSPLRLAPEERKQFVEQVFTDSGYDYAATLHALAESEFTARDQYAKDMMELLTLPHREMGTAVPDNKIYSPAELQDLEKIKTRFPTS